MKYFLFTTIISFVLSLILSQTSAAQVTIGSAEEPISGALLQLKDKDNVTSGSYNATRGLGLPRVGLTIYNELKDIDPTNTTRPDPDLHIGLVVYNINHFCKDDYKIYYPGIYVWDGSEWVPVQEEPYVSKENKVWITQDQEGKAFRSAKFGNAGIWMIDNLAVTTYASQAANTVAMPVNSGLIDSFREPGWAYPAPNPAPDPLPAGATGAINGTDKYYYNNFREYGLLYNWMAATGGANSLYGPGNFNQDINQRRTAAITPGPLEVEIVETKGYIQGICPNDWHLPSDREWSMLEREIFANPEQYSYISNEEQATWQYNQWQPVWDEFTQLTANVYQAWRVANTNPDNGQTSNLAMAMKRPCILAHQDHNGTDMFSRGKSFLPQDGGFNVMPAGGITIHGTRFYGKVAFLWTSSYAGVHPDATATTTTNRLAILRGLNFDPTLLSEFGYTAALTSNGRPNLSDFNSVRCIYHGTAAPF